jgi:hypothetical protein
MSLQLMYSLRNHMSTLNDHIPRWNLQSLQFHVNLLNLHTLSFTIQNNIERYRFTHCGILVFFIIELFCLIV